MVETVMKMETLPLLLVAIGKGYGLMELLNLNTRP